MSAIDWEKARRQSAVGGRPGRRASKGPTAGQQKEVARLARLAGIPYPAPLTFEEASSWIARLRRRR